MVELPAQVEDLVAKFTETGTEVEGVETVGASFDHIVTAKVVEKNPHPDSDHLWVTMVDVGQDEPLQIVCGAQNFNQGDHIVTAMVGAELPGDFKIKKSKLRGVVSNGMNCSARELGLGDDHEGIMILPEGTPVGIPFAQYAGLSDQVLELEVTPNRPDCLSVYGVAREVGAILDKPYYLEEKPLVEGFEKTGDAVSVTIDDAERCMRYVARVIKDVKVGPSPEWLANRVVSCGARSINNVVDVTNYVMFLLGQPLHAFDYDFLPKDASGKATIVVRGAHEGEPFTTLDGEARTLTSDMTVITDGTKPVALAGVMGGLDSEVTNETTTILLESAVFSSAHTSRTSRNLQLFSESSMRFERGVDQSNAAFVADYAAALLAEVTGGTVLKDAVDAYPVKPETITLTLRMDRLRTFVGAPITNEEACRFLTALGCNVKEADAPNDFVVVVPTYRPDLIREIDLYEEVLRLWGMERVPSTIPAAKNHFGGLTEEQKLSIKIGRTLRACGINETITYSLVAPNDLERLNMSEVGRGDAVELINPMSEEQSVMRRSLIPGLLRSVEYNQKHGVENVQLYESGTVFFGAEGKKQPREKTMLAAVLTGSYVETGWNTHAVELGFFDVKGVLENLLREMCVEKVRFRVANPEDYPHLQPGRAAEVLSGGTLLGWLGEIHPKSLANFDAKGPVAAFELDEDALVKCARPSRPYVDVPRLPAVEMDFAIVVDEEVTCERLEQMIASAGGKLLESVRLFDVYRDAEKLGANKKSMAFKLVYRAADHTLTGEEVEKAHEKVVTKVTRGTGGEQRA